MQKRSLQRFQVSGHDKRGKQDFMDFDLDVIEAITPISREFWVLLDWEG